MAKEVLVGQGIVVPKLIEDGYKVYMLSHAEFRSSETDPFFMDFPGSPEEVRSLIYTLAFKFTGVPLEKIDHIVTTDCGIIAIWLTLGRVS